MIRAKNIFFVLVILSFTSCITSKTAVKDFNNAEYYDASLKFEKIIKEGDAQNSYLLAESLRKSNRLWQSEKYYKDAITYGIRDEMAYYYLTLSLKSNSNYDAADSLILHYLSKGKEESVLNLMMVMLYLEIILV